MNIMVRRKTETDSVYFLKILLYFILGSIWLQFRQIEILPGVMVFPIGLVAGVVFARHDHFRIDRKIEYAVLIGATVLSFVAPIGVVLLI